MRSSLWCGMYCNCFPKYSVIFFCKTIEVRHTSSCFLLFVASVTLNILLKHFIVRNEQLKFIFNNPWSSRSSPVCTTHSSANCFVNLSKSNTIEGSLGRCKHIRLASKRAALEYKCRYLCHVCRGHLRRLLKGTATKNDLSFVKVKDKFIKKKVGLIL